MIAVKNVRPLPEYKLELSFSDGSIKCFDVTPYLSKGIFAELKDLRLFNAVRVDFDTISWPNGADICPEVLAKESV